MEAFVVIALIGFGLLAAELLLPTGGVLALFGIAGLVAGGILALGSSDSAADWIGGALITIAVLSGISFFLITRRVVRTTRFLPKRGGTEEMVGAPRSTRPARSSCAARCGRRASPTGLGPSGSGIRCRWRRSTG
jgi:membrane-bound ClpP family serine protease